MMMDEKVVLGMDGGESLSRITFGTMDRHTVSLPWNEEMGLSH